MIADMARTAIEISPVMARHFEVPSAASAEQQFAATLAGHALLPAATFVPAPAGAPKDAQMPGKFTGAARKEVAGSVMRDTGALHGKRPTGIRLPSMVNLFRVCQAMR